MVPFHISAWNVRIAQKAAPQTQREIEGMHTDTSKYRQEKYAVHSPTMSICRGNLKAIADPALVQLCQSDYTPYLPNLRYIPLRNDFNAFIT